MLKYWIWFSNCQGISQREKLVLLEHFRTPLELYYADSDSIAAISGLNDQAKASLLDKSLTEAEKILERCSRLQIQIVSYQDAAYPQRLKTICDSPLLLYYKGSLPSFEESAVIAVVGTRSATPYGLRCARRLGYQLADGGAMVISGMARGIDGQAMEGALSADGSVVGVLGCGVDVIYPLSNKALYADILRRGCLMSEYPPGTQPLSWHFPQRNRILSALSSGVLVIEAPEKSGALITAQLAAEQGRDVFTVPGNIDQDSCAGSNRLLQDGAIPVFNGWDVLKEYQHMYPERIQKTQLSHKTLKSTAELAVLESIQEAEKSALEKEKQEKPKKDIDKKPNDAYSGLNNRITSLSGNEKLLYEALTHGEALVDNLIAQTGLSTSTMLVTLTALELKGLVRRLPGKRYALVQGK